VLSFGHASTLIYSVVAKVRSRWSHTSKARDELKVVLLHLWRVNVKTIPGFINITLDDFS
jgi:hypothetical protein